MPKYIAVAGKGGTGKTTVAANLVRYLVERPGVSVLAIDADPNSNLAEAMGLTPGGAIADILEETKQVKALPAGMSRPAWVEYRLNQLILETDRFDVLTMGTPEGPGCYCYPNDLLRGNLAALGSNYDYVVIDNEAGLEHLSRRVESDIELMLVVSDPTVRGLRSAGRVKEIVGNLKTRVGHMGLVINRVRTGDLGPLEATVDATGIPLAGAVPEDPAVMQFDLEGRALTALPPDAPSVKALRDIFARLGL
jgi:CO dehydrogenase maturation factor